MKRGRHLMVFILFLPGGALSVLLSEGVGVETLMKLLFKLLSLLSSESAQWLLLLRKLLSLLIFRIFYWNQ